MIFQQPIYFCLLPTRHLKREKLHVWPFLEFITCCSHVSWVSVVWQCHSCWTHNQGCISIKGWLHWSLEKCFAESPMLHVHKNLLPEHDGVTGEYWRDTESCWKTLFRPWYCEMLEKPIYILCRYSWLVFSQNRPVEDQYWVLGQGDNPSNLLANLDESYYS